jgi:hypothetical protein
MEVRLVEVRLAEECPEEKRPAEERPVEACPLKERPREESPVEVCFAKVCSVEVRSVEMRPGEICLAKVCSFEVSSVEVEPAEVYPVEVCPAKVWVYSGVYGPPCIPGRYSLFQACEVFLICPRSYFLFDHLEGLGRHLTDILHPTYPIEIVAHLVGVLLAQVIEQHRTLGPLRHGEPSGEHCATIDTAVTLTWGHWSSSPPTHPLSHG